jgi:hypothetical protein
MQFSKVGQMKGDEEEEGGREIEEKRGSKDYKVL